MLTVIVLFNGLNLKQNKMNIVRQVSFESANRKKDRSVSIRFTTDLEQSTEEFMEIDKMLNSRGILYYSDRGELTQEEIDTLDEVDIEMQGKSKSQRMRSVMFLLWKQQGEKGNFKDFYSEKMESIITKMKDKLD